MKSELRTASEIAELKIKGLPETREGVRVKAEREGWYSEVRFGRGGQHKVYEVPGQYLGKTLGDKPSNVQQLAENGDLLQAIVTAVETWQESRRVHIPTDRKAALIALLYQYFLAQNGKTNPASIVEMINKVA